jgi:hypothetical protein
VVNLGGRRFVAQWAPCSAIHITVYRAARQLIWGLPVAFTKSYQNSCRRMSSTPRSSSKAASS